MDHAISRDGTRIAFKHSGSGPPLLLVHGTAADHSRWAPVLPALEERYTVFAMDRRGRGGSGDATEYSIEDEYEDIVAVVETIGPGVTVLGHSFGAICALGAARRTDGFDRMVLYEPPIPTPPEGSFTQHHLIRRIEEQLANGDREGATETMFRDVVGVPAEQVEALKASPVWQARVAAAHTLPRELWAVESYVFKPEEFVELRVPTLLLVGGESPDFFQRATQAVAAALPNASVVALPGQQHVAMNSAPKLFVEELNKFLLAGPVIAP